MYYSNVYLPYLIPYFNPEFFAPLFLTGGRQRNQSQLPLSSLRNRTSSSVQIQHSQLLSSSLLNNLNLLVSSQFENNNNNSDSNNPNCRLIDDDIVDICDDFNADHVDTAADLNQKLKLSDSCLIGNLDHPTSANRLSSSYLDLNLHNSTSGGGSSTRNRQFDLDFNSIRSHQHLNQRSQSPPNSLWIPTGTTDTSSTVGGHLNSAVKTAAAASSVAAAAAAAAALAGSTVSNSEFLSSRSESAKYNGDNLAASTSISPTTSALLIAADLNNCATADSNPLLREFLSRESSICLESAEVQAAAAETCTSVNPVSTLLTPAGTHYGVEEAVLGSEDPIAAAIDLLEPPNLPQPEQPSPMRHYSPLYHSSGHSATSASLHHRSASLLPTEAQITASSGIQPGHSSPYSDHLLNQLSISSLQRPQFTRSQSVPEQHHYLDSADEELLLEAAAATLDDPLPITPSVVLNQPLINPSYLNQPSRASSRASQHQPIQFHPTHRPLSLSSDWLPTSRRSATAQDLNHLGLLQSDLQRASQKTRRLTSGLSSSRHRTTRTSPPLTLGRTLELVTGSAEQEQNRHRSRTAYAAAAALANELAAKATKVKKRGKIRIDSEEWRLQHAHLLSDPTLFPSGLGIEQDAWMSVEDVRSGRWARWDALVKQESQETRDSGIETGSCFTSSEDSTRGSASDPLHHYYHKKVVGSIPCTSMSLVTKSLILLYL